MNSFMGIGTTLYGKRDIDPIDKSYIATEWKIFFLFPIKPIASYRVWRGETTTSAGMGMIGATVQYRMRKVELNKKQIDLTRFIAMVCLILFLWGVIVFSN